MSVGESTPVGQCSAGEVLELVIRQVRAQVCAIDDAATRHHVVGVLMFAPSSHAGSVLRVQVGHAGLAQRMVRVLDDPGVSVTSAGDAAVVCIEDAGTVLAGLRPSGSAATGWRVFPGRLAAIGYVRGALGREQTGLSLHGGLQVLCPDAGAAIRLTGHLARIGVSCSVHLDVIQSTVVVAHRNIEALLWRVGARAAAVAYSAAVAGIPADLLADEHVDGQRFVYVESDVAARVPVHVARWAGTRIPAVTRSLPQRVRHVLHLAHDRGQAAS